MKKVFGVIMFLSFLIIGCQEGGSIVAPDNSNLNLEKKSDATEFVPTSIDSIVTNGNRPGLVRT